MFCGNAAFVGGKKIPCIQMVIIIIILNLCNNFGWMCLSGYNLLGLGQSKVACKLLCVIATWIKIILNT